MVRTSTGGWCSPAPIYRRVTNPGEGEVEKKKIVNLLSVLVILLVPAISMSQSNVPFYTVKNKVNNGVIFVNTGKWTASKGFKTNNYLKGRMWNGATTKSFAFCVTSDKKIAWTYPVSVPSRPGRVGTFTLKCAGKNGFKMWKNSGRYTSYAWQNIQNTGIPSNVLTYPHAGGQQKLCLAIVSAGGSKVNRIPGAIVPGSSKCRYWWQPAKGFKTSSKYDVIVKNPDHEAG